MPITFNCPVCGTQIETPDDLSESIGRCPACESSVRIPAPTALTDPFGPPPEAAPITGPTDDGNPYRSPIESGRETVARRLRADLPRTGPPWERDGMSVRSWVRTAGGCGFTPIAFFTGLRREGGFAPATFVAIGLVLAAVLAAIPGSGDPRQWTLPVRIVAYPFYSLLGTPMFAFFGAMYVMAVHGLLSLKPGRVLMSEATFRVVAYSFGTSVLLVGIPFVGGPLFVLTELALIWIGLACTHDISYSHAAAGAVGPPAILVLLAVLMLAFQRL